MEAGVAFGNARERSNDGSPTLAPSSSRPSPPVTALKRPANHHATETAGGEITRLRTKSSRSTAQEGKGGRPTSLPRHPSGAEEGSAESCTRRGSWSSGAGRGERPAGDGGSACEVRKKSERRRSTLGLMEQAGSAPHVSGRFEESADIIEYGHMAEWRIAGDD